jgi:two-component system cell cycle response regulator DivK
MSTYRILAVDDNVSNLKLVTYLLSAAEYDVKTAATAHEVLAILPEFKPDLILLDIQLPDVDGLELTRQLRNDPHTRDMAIVAVTAYAMTGDEAKARAAGVDGYVTKPIEKDSFRRMVAQVLAQRGRK